MPTSSLPKPKKNNEGSNGMQKNYKVCSTVNSTLCITVCSDVYNKVKFAIIMVILMYNAVEVTSLFQCPVQCEIYLTKQCKTQWAVQCAVEFAVKGEYSDKFSVQ